VDAQPAGYSRVWIEHVLRGEFGFRGVVFSDDISMAAAEGAGSIGARIDLHRAAGCDLVLVCKPEIVSEAIATQRGRTPCPDAALESLRGRVAQTWPELIDNPQRTRFITRITALDAKEAA
jgi:beta-N-acetylhexosaminidase